MQERAMRWGQLGFGPHCQGDSGSLPCALLLPPLSARGVQAGCPGSLEAWLEHILGVRDLWDRSAFATKSMSARSWQMQTQDPGI